MEKLLQILSEIDNMETLIKIYAVDGKINKQEAQELLYITKRITDIGLK